MAAQRAFEVVALDTAEVVPLGDDGLAWVPMRRRLGVEAFGVNAFRGDRCGDVVIEDHVESSDQEELYVVVRGVARVRVDDADDVLDVNSGSVVFVRRPESRCCHARLGEEELAIDVLGRAVAIDRCERERTQSEPAFTRLRMRGERPA
jgi:mannose-6-phosphate isomerase-like protein (cupin superfamily)